MKKNTFLTHKGRKGGSKICTVNSPVAHASTILFSDFDAFQAYENKHTPGLVYGRQGGLNQRELGEVVAGIEGADHCFITPSGLSAIMVILLSILNQGDHVLIVDSVYYPVRNSMEKILKRYGISYSFYDPARPIDELYSFFTPKTKLVYTESPGSMTFEMQDIRELSKKVHEKGAMLLVDNTWATGLNFKPLEYGADISVLSLSKYLSGHSDLLLGAIAVNKNLVETIYDTYNGLGICAGPDDCYLALRGIRSAGIRYKHHFDSAIKIANWLDAQNFVDQIFFPPFKRSRGHDLWKRDYKEGASVFSFTFASYVTEKQIKTFVDSLQLFGLGFGWGGFESLIAPVKPKQYRQFWQSNEYCIRLHIGLEDVDDLIADLARAAQILED